MRVDSKLISVITNLLCLKFSIRQVLVFLSVEVRTVRGVHNTLISILAFVLLYLWISGIDVILVEFLKLVSTCNLIKLIAYFDFLLALSVVYSELPKSKVISNVLRH